MALALDVVAATLAGGDSVTSVTGAGLTFSQRFVHSTLSIWQAVATAALSNAAIAVAFNTPAGNEACAIGVSGANVAAPWDSHAGLPAYVTGGGGPSTTDLYSTSNANDFVLAVAGLNSSGAANPAGFTNAVGGNAGFLNLWYEIVSAKQTNAIVTVGGYPSYVLVDAIQASAAKVLQATLAEGAHTSSAIGFVSSAPPPQPPPIRISLTGALN
jgi:hypothetical protein